jgi:hypothetical protein
VRRSIRDLFASSDLEVSFRERPEAIPGDYRTAWRVSVLCMILFRCWGSKTALDTLSVLFSRLVEAMVTGRKASRRAAGSIRPFPECDAGSRDRPRDGSHGRERNCDSSSSWPGPGDKSMGVGKRPDGRAGVLERVRRAHQSETNPAASPRLYKQSSMPLGWKACSAPVEKFRCPMR